MRDLNKVILNLKYDKRELEESLEESKSKQSYKVSLAVKDARRFERSHHSIENDKVNRQSSDLTHHFIVSWLFLG